MGSSLNSCLESTTPLPTLSGLYLVSLSLLLIKHWPLHVPCSPQMTQVIPASGPLLKLGSPLGMLFPRLLVPWLLIFLLLSPQCHLHREDFPDYSHENIPSHPPCYSPRQHPHSFPPLCSSHAQLCSFRVYLLRVRFSYQTLGSIRSGTVFLFTCLFHRASISVAVVTS